MQYLTTIRNNPDPQVFQIGRNDEMENICIHAGYSSRSTRHNRCGCYQRGHIDRPVFQLFAGWKENSCFHFPDISMGCIFFSLFVFFFSLFFLRTPGECLNNRKRWTEGKNPSGTPRFVESRRLLPSLLAWNATASGSPSPPGNPSFFFFFFSFFSCFYYTKIIIRQLVSSQPIGPFKKYI